MAYTNADVYAPDDAPRDANGNMIMSSQAVYKVTPEHPAGAKVTAAMSPVLALAALGLFAYFWSRRR